VLAALREVLINDRDGVALSHKPTLSSDRVAQL
jgi:hypothetical protein